MPPLNDAVIRAKICEALKYRTSGGVEWKQTASEWILKNLELSPHEVGDLLYDYVENGGNIQEVKEEREGYRYCKYHFDFVVIAESKKVYVETILVERKMGPVVVVVNAHPAD